MRSRILMSLPALLVPLLTSCGGGKDDAAKSNAAVTPAGAPAAKTDHSADEAAIRAIYQALPDQLNTGNAAAMSATFADDGVEIMPGAPQTKGPAAIQKLMAATFASMKNLKASVGTSIVTVSEAGDMAVIEAPYQMSWTDAKGKKAADHGTTMTIFKKVNGQWKILYDTNVSEVAPPQ